MSWEEEVFNAFPLGAERTAPEISNDLQAMHERWPINSIRSKVYNVLAKNCKYGLVEKTDGVRDRAVIWRRKA